MRVLSCFIVDPIWGLLALNRYYKVNFEKVYGLRLFPWSLDDSIFSRLPVYDDINQERSFTQAKVRVSFWN